MGASQMIRTSHSDADAEIQGTTDPSPVFAAPLKPMISFESRRSNAATPIRTYNSRPTSCFPLCYGAESSPRVLRVSAIGAQGDLHDAIESVNAQLRKIVKTRGHFPTDEAATKLLWLALRNITADWSRAAHDWKAAMNQFAILYEDRFTRNHL
jgi:putative transposase